MELNTQNLYRKVLSNPIGVPQFPGGDFLGMDLQQIRSVIKTQKRAKGFTFPVTVGTSNFNIDISGTAKIFLGFTFGGATATPVISDSFTLVINNEIIIQDGQTPSFSTSRFQGDREYYFFPRPLTGTDEINLRFQSAGAGSELFNVWYI